MKELEVNKIIHGDCLEVMKTMPDKCVDLVLTDPPYGIGADKGSNFYGHTGGRDYNDNWDFATPTTDYFEEILRVAKNVVIFGGQFFTDKLPVNGHWVVWDKKGGIDFDNPFGDCELAWTNLARKSVKKYTVIQQGFISEERDRYHPTQKPISLFGCIIRDYSEEGQIILDPFGGSCTTAVACKNLNRKYICIEKEEKYYNLCLERLAATPNSLFLV